MTRFSWFASLTLLGLAHVPTASAATVHCDDEYGSCTVTSDNSDSMTCECTGGEHETAGTGETGTNDWEGLSEAELLVICEEGLMQMCDPSPRPVEGIPCENAQGRCVVDNDPFDTVSCSCNEAGGGGDGGGSGGGNGWAGLSEEELQEVCFQELDSFCPVTPETTTDSATTDVGSDTGSLDEGGATTGPTTAEGTSGVASADTTDGHGEHDTGVQSGTSGADAGDDGAGGTTTGVADTGSVDASTTAASGGGGDASSGGDDAAAGEDDVSKGCRVDPRGGAGGSFALLVLAAMGLRRRRTAA